VGAGKNRNQGPSTERNALSSVGVGLIYAGDPKFDAQIYYGYALQKISTPNRDLQDRGIHFSLNYRL
jgi:hemolysin activation/secretion protein